MDRCRSGRVSSTLLKLERENKSRVLGALESCEYTLIVDCNSAIAFEESSDLARSSRTNAANRLCHWAFRWSISARRMK
jgi:hypothetical protein